MPHEIYGYAVTRKIYDTNKNGIVDYVDNGVAGGLMTNTPFGGMVSGYYNSVYIDITQLGPLLAGTNIHVGGDGRLSVTGASAGATADGVTITNGAGGFGVVVSNIGARLSDDSTITNDPAGVLSVPSYSSNAMGQLVFRQRVEDSWEATGQGRINATKWIWTGSTGPLATVWADRDGI